MGTEEFGIVVRENQRTRQKWIGLFAFTRYYNDITSSKNWFSPIIELSGGLPKEEMEQFISDKTEFLLKSGINIDLRFSLKIAITFRQKKLAKLLVAYGAKLTSDDTEHLLIRGNPVYEYLYNPAYGKILKNSINI